MMHGTTNINSNIMIILYWIVPNDARKISHGQWCKTYSSHTA